MGAVVPPCSIMWKLKVDHESKEALLLQNNAGRIVQM